MSNNSIDNLRKKAFVGALWSFGERIGAQLVSLIVSIILARLLIPADYAAVSVVTIFFNFANVIISGGLNTALIQKKDATIVDYSTILYISLAISVVLYAIFFIIAPLIANIYGIDILVKVIRIMAIVLVVNAVRSILSAYISNTLQFRIMFIATMIATIISAIFGIVMAFQGCGVWALVTQQMINSFVGTGALFIVAHLKFKLVFSIDSFKELFRYGWKIFVTSIITVIYDEINPLIVGLRFSAVDLSFYSKGKNFPSILNSTIGSTLSTVLFPVISKVQDDISSVLSITRRYIKVASFLIFPIMCGFFAISENFVLILLTEKWLQVVPYIQIFCVSYMFDIIQIGNLQTIKAIGRSDIALILEVIKKSMYFIVITMFVLFSKSPIILATSSIICTVFATLINTFPNRKLIGYRYRYQIADILPNLLIAIIMAMIVYAMNRIELVPLLLIVLQIIVGITVYILLSIITKNDNYAYLKNHIISIIRRRLHG